MHHKDELFSKESSIYSPPSNWRDLVAQADPFIKYACPNWRKNLEVVSQEGDAFGVGVREQSGSLGPLFLTVSSRCEAKVEKLAESIKDNFKLDDDAMTRLRGPWTREPFYRHYDHEVLSVVAVLAGVKPAALLSEASIYHPEVRVALGKLDRKWIAAEFIKYDGLKQLVVGIPDSVSLIKQAYSLRRDAEMSGDDIPKEYFRALGKALGYSDSAISYFIYRNANLDIINRPKNL
jgi:hypothetical protein